MPKGRGFTALLVNPSANFCDVCVSFNSISHICSVLLFFGFCQLFTFRKAKIKQCFIVCSCLFHQHPPQ